MSEFLSIIMRNGSSFNTQMLSIRCIQSRFFLPFSHLVRGFVWKWSSFAIDGRGKKMRASISISLLSLSLLLSHNKCVNFISDELFHHHHFARYAYKLHEFIAFPFVLVAFLLTVWCWMCVCVCALIFSISPLRTGMSLTGDRTRHNEWIRNDGIILYRQFFDGRMYNISFGRMRSFAHFALDT